MCPFPYLWFHFGYVYAGFKSPDRSVFFLLLFDDLDRLMPIDSSSRGVFYVSLSVYYELTVFSCCSHGNSDCDRRQPLAITKWMMAIVC